MYNQPFINRMPLLNILCGAGENKTCDQLQGLFMYAYNWEGGECGLIGTDPACAKGKDHVDGPDSEYFACYV